MGLRAFLTDRRTLVTVLGTAGAWFLFDYAYYGNTLSLPAILKDVSPHATLITKLAWTLGLFLVFARPGLPPRLHQDGPHRPPASAAHRLRCHGARFRWPSAPFPS